jgi:hypothetical protein
MALSVCALLACALASTAPAAAQTCFFGNGPDVIVGEITGPSNYSATGGLEALSLGTTSCNLGNQPLDWIASTPDHPVIGGNLYRLKDYGGWWAMEQVGMSWLKHGFFALQGGTCCSNCNSNPNGSALGVGCSDPYTSGRNGGQSSLGPRWQVNANNGTFTYPPANPGWGGSTARRLEVLISDLESTSSTTTRYYGESHYVTPDDAFWGNQDNNASYRELSCTGGGNSWSFGFIGSTERRSSAIKAWVDSGVDPNAQYREFDLTGDGHLILGYSATDLGGGTWHYEYALYNMNSDDSIGSFAVPIPTGVNITNVGFHDATYRNGDGEANVSRTATDWAFTQASGLATWASETFSQNANANALRWGSTYNFRFDADAPPQDADLRMTRFKPGAGLFDTVTAQGPGAGDSSTFCNNSDGSLAACPCANPGNPDSGCDNVQSTGGVFMEATSFTPDGAGGGTATFTGTDYNPAGSPAYVLIRSTTLIPAVSAFDGAICLGGTVVRVGSGFAVAGTAVEPYTHGAMASPGSNYYQMWYRNQPAAFCTPDAANLSNGYNLAW